MLHEELTSDILKAFYEVHKVLGFGFLEQVYQNALYKELSDNRMKVECQKEILVHYKGECVGRYVADMVVNNSVILELKAVQTLKVEHEWQLINYLKATGIEVGLLLNFGHSAEFKRKVFTSKSVKSA
ncbi:MAG: GxxExxY protein [Bacteroidaceae bacterium]|nr:GxxExxY protein [Bacteroidaceae bacterium]